MTTEEYLKWVRLYKPFFRLIKQYTNRELPRPCLIVMGDQDHIFLGSAKNLRKIKRMLQSPSLKGAVMWYQLKVLKYLIKYH